MNRVLLTTRPASSDIVAGKLLSEIQMSKQSWLRSSSLHYDFHKALMSPSDYLQICELTMKPDQLVRYLDTLWKLHKSEDERQSTAAYVYVPSDGPGVFFPFCPSPPALLMKIKEVHVVLETKVNFRNDDTVPRVLKLLPSEASNFRIIPPVGGRNKIAPGMSITYTIQFQPESIQDYYYEVNCLTDRGFLVIPVFVLGPRAILDFPDRVDMPVAPVRYPVNKMLTLRNIGDKEARFSLFAKDPFQVKPNQGTLAVQDRIQIEITFLPVKVDQYSGLIVLSYDTGETIYIAVQGSCEDINIRLDKNSLHLPKAFVGHSSQRVVTIVNNSSILSEFIWKAGVKEKEKKKARFGFELGEELIYPGSAPISPDGVFHAYPVKGELWPQSSVETVIYFRPNDDQVYERTVYCEVLGRESSLPLKLTGEGKGPLLSFKKKHLDVGELLINMTHSFEIILENLGEMLTSFRYRPSSSIFSKYCTFIPATAPMAPYQTAAISIVVSARKLGTFCEEFEFEVEGSNAPAILTISGKIIAPKLGFNVPKIAAGQIACGFRNVNVVNLEDNSSISVIFHIRVIEAAQVHYENAVPDKDLPLLSTNSILGDKNSEITVIPINGTIDPNSSRVIKIIINPKTVKVMSYLLLVDVQGVGKNVGNLFITAESVVTNLVVEDPFVALDTAFISFLYNRDIRLKNEGSVPAVYKILPQKDQENASLSFQASEESQVITPRETGRAKITITPQRIGYCEEKLSILLTGNEDKPLEVLLSCTGCGPVVDIQPEALDWGTVPVLTKTSKTLTLQNLSPISANFTAQMVNINSVWKLEPSQGVVTEKSRIDVQVYAYFQDTQRFQDKISIKISGGATTVIPVSAKAFGSTITIQPPLPNPLELTPQFSNQLCQFHYRVSNLGKKTHQLMWVVEPFPPPGFTEAKKHSGLTQLVFQVIPPTLDLQPGCSSDIIIQGYSSESKSVTESLVCYSCKGRTGGKEVIFKTELRMELINPCLEFSTNFISFSAVINTDELQEKYVYPLFLKNITSLICTVHLFLKSPFQIMEEGAKLSYHTIIRIPTNHTVGVLITFNPFYKPGKFSSQVEEDLIISYYEHPQIDTIKMKGEVLFPNLEFSRRELRFNVNNGSEVMESIDIINISPMEVNYKWKIYVTERSQQPPLKRDSYELSHTTYGEEIFIYSENSIFRNIEEEWDKVLRILPVNGTLKPRGSQTVLFFFWGESSIYLHAEAICSVHRGPRYVIDIAAKSSELQYTLHPTNIYLENEVFTNLVQVKSMLCNKGNGSFNFSIRSSQIKKTASQKITGTAGENKFNLKMPFDEKLKQIKQKLGIQTSINPVPLHISPERGRLQPGEQQIIIIQFIPMVPWEYKISLKVQIAYFEPRFINIHIKSTYPYLSLYPSLENTLELSSYQNQVKEYLNSSVYSVVFASLEKLPEDIRDLEPKQQIDAIRMRLKTCFDEYYLPIVNLNFGYVILGNIVTKEVHIFNNSQTPLCFRVEHEKLAKYGFHTDIDQVRCLPPLKGLILQLTFDPRSANIPVGEIDISTTIKVRLGPSNVIRLGAIVTMPTLILSDSQIDFGDVQCSQCQITTIQLFNNGFVPCEWGAFIAGAKKRDDLNNDKEDVKVTDPFEVMPLSGILQEGQTVNVEIKFQPLVGKKYSTIVTFNLNKSSMTPQLSLCGTGLETILEFPKKYLQFSCILPYSGFQDRTVKIKNPSAFPIEIYAVDHDQQFSEEDRILRVVQEYDKRKTILLPPREAGFRLPVEFYNFYDDLLNQLERFLYFCYEKWTMEPSIEESTKEITEPENFHGDITASTEGETVSSNQSSSNIQEVFFSTQLLNNYDETERNIIIKYTEEMMQQNGLWNKTFLPKSGIGREFFLNHVSRDELEELLQLMLRVFKEDIMKKPTCSPVKTALEKYISPIKYPAVIDKSRFQIHIIVISAPLTDSLSSDICEKISQHYGIQHININDVIIEAMRSAQTPAEISAKECVMAQQPERSDDSSPVLDSSLKVKKGLKVSVAKVPSKVEVKMSMPLPELSSSEELLESKIKFHLDDTTPDRLIAVSIPIQAFLDILTDRLKREDCKSGVIIDGIPNSFFPNINLCCLALLKIIGDKKYIYFVTMDKDYNHLKDIEEEQAKEAEIKRREQEEEERKRANSMTVDEYRQLSEAEKEHIDSILFQMKLDWLKSIRAFSDKDEESKKKKQKWKDEDSQKRTKLKMGRDEGGHMETKSAGSDSLDEDDKLPRLFHNFRSQWKELETTLESFDRVAGISELPIELALIKSKKPAKDAKTGLPPPPKKKELEKTDDVTVKSEEFVDFGVPIIVVDLCPEKTLEQIVQMLIEILPPVDVLREELGLNDQALYRPPPYKLSVVRFPPREITAQPSEHFVFVDFLPSPADTMSPTPSFSLDTGGKKKRTTLGGQSTGGASITGPISKRKVSKITTRSQKPRSDQMLDQVTTPVPEPAEDAMRGVTDAHRWIVPPGNEIILYVRFQSNDIGLFDQVLQFETVGNRRQYRVFCRGLCYLPDICRLPETIFRNYTITKTSSQGQILRKIFVQSNETFYFGPLLLTQEGPENLLQARERKTCDFVIQNNSFMPVNINFFLMRECLAYEVLPMKMKLMPGEADQLHVSVNAIGQGILEDRILCCIQDNPEPFIMKFSSAGTIPELELDKRSIQFNHVLLHRRELRKLTLTNKSQLPLLWYLVGYESFGEDFSFPITRGKLEALNSIEMPICFHSSKPMSLVKKPLKIEISDVERSLGIIQTEMINISVEAYDVMIDLTFSKVNADNSLDFGVMKVDEDRRETITLRNKGKFDVNFLLVFVERREKWFNYIRRILIVNPTEGKLGPFDKNTVVTVGLQSSYELSIENEHILDCLIMDPMVDEGKEIIGRIPLRFTLKTFFSKFSLNPESGLHFGAIAVGSRVTQSFTLSNIGYFDFSYLMFKKESLVSESKLVPLKETKSTVFKGKSGKALAATGKLQLEFFSVTPSGGVLLADDSITFQVECAPENLGILKEDIIIDITDLDLDQYSSGVLFSLVGEACIPEINITNKSLIFEEHCICFKSHDAKLLLQTDIIGVYSVDDNVFTFKSIPLQKSVQARFNLFNNSKVPCEVILSLKPSTAKKDQESAFKIHPEKVVIPPFQDAFATVVFTPTMLDRFVTTFIAHVEGVPSQFPSDRLVFDIQGEGILPTVTVTKPLLHSRLGHTVITFHQVLIGQSTIRFFQVKNTGSLPCYVTLDLNDASKYFTMQPTMESYHCFCKEKDNIDEACDDEEMLKELRSIVNGTFFLEVNEAADFQVTFEPDTIGKFGGLVKLYIHDNPYETIFIKLYGEGFTDDIIIRVHQDLVEEYYDKREVADNDYRVEKLSYIRFGECAIHEAKKVLFTMSSSLEEIIRFEWEDHEHVTIIPQTGHLRGNSSKDFQLTICFDEPGTFNREPVKCQINSITLTENAPMDDDWDDRKKLLKWGKRLQFIDEGIDGEGQYVQTKSFDIEPEPAYEIIPGTQRTEEITISAFADYCSYVCDTSVIHFSDTFVFENRNVTFTIENVSRLYLECYWNIMMLKTQRRSEALEAGGISEFVPFSVHPSSAVIKSGSKMVFTVTFTPLEAEFLKGRLYSSIPNLSPTASPPEIIIDGQGLVPCCHFELEDSDYITKGRRDSSLPVPHGISLENRTKVLELSAVGIGKKVTKKFNIVNPSDKDRPFTWSLADTSVQDTPKFTCLNSAGILKKGKKTEVTFQFEGRKVGTEECGWIFSIPEFALTLPFLLVGHVREPEVFPEKPSIVFKRIMKGASSTEVVHLCNHEEFPVHFEFDLSSCTSEDLQVQLEIVPLKGILPPKSRFQLKFKLHADSEGEFCLNPHCRVERRTVPLIINVRAQVFVSRCVVCINEEGSKTEVFPDTPCRLNMGETEVNNYLLSSIHILNNGSVNFEIKWNLPPMVNERGKKKDFLLEVNPAVAFLKMNESQECEIKLSFSKVISITDEKLTLKVSHGPAYIFLLSGSSEEVAVKFSHNKIAFGPHFILKPGMNPIIKSFTVKNPSNKAVSFECLYKPSGHMAISLEDNIIEAGKSRKVQAAFFPAEVRRYKDTIPFLINETRRKTVEISGEGVALKLDVDHPTKILKLGAVRLGKVVKKRLTVTNFSKLPVTASFFVSIKNPPDFPPECLSVWYGGDGYLPAQSGKYHLHVTFAPKMRVASLQAEIIATVDFIEVPLIILQGCCQAMEVSLVNTVMNMGVVAEKCVTSRKLIMNNSGDFGTSFKWEKDKLLPNFSINPEEGYLLQRQQVVFNVNFHPTKIAKNILCENVKCLLDQGHILHLTLSGACIQVPPSQTIIQFTAIVRQTDLQSISIQNPSRNPWKLQPILTGEYWTAPEVINIKPLSSVNYDLTYKPLTMTKEGKEHKGSVYIALPDGTALLYNLSGIAEPPKPISTIARDIQCRTEYKELLTIENWLSYNHRFQVVLDYSKERAEADAFFITGNPFIDVPAKGKKDYKIQFFGYKEVAVQFKVIFKSDEEPGEYEFYELNFHTYKAGPVSSIRLQSRLRQSTVNKLPFKNPLQTKISLHLTCNLEAVTVPSMVSIAPEAEIFIPLEYSPLKIEESQGILEIMSQELGQFVYNVFTKSVSAAPEKGTIINAYLGTPTTTTVRTFNPISKQRVEYVAKVDHSDFQVEKSLIVVVGSPEVSFDVIYDPTMIGETKANVTLTSSIMGDFVFPLIATCHPPKPQGPILIKVGSWNGISYRNPFNASTTFVFQVDNPQFILQKSSDVLKPRKDGKIMVNFEPWTTSARRENINSKLMITSATTDRVQWIYYLKGVFSTDK